MRATTRRRLSTGERRQQLLSVGAEMFASRPYGEVWIEEIAEVAGVSRGLLYHYFPTKRDFFAAVVGHEADMLMRLLVTDPGLPFEQRVVAGLDAYLDFVDRHECGYRLLHRGALAADEGIRAIVDGGYAEQERRILAALDQDTGHDGGQEAARMAVRAWFSFVTAACLDWLDRRAVDRDELRDMCARTLLAAVGTPAGID